MQGLASYMLLHLPDPPAAAREMRDLVSNRFVDEPPSGRMDPEREVKINHYAAHFAETFWEDVAKALAAQRTSQN